jgi:hypothetical protein
VHNGTRAVKGDQEGLDQGTKGQRMDHDQLALGHSHKALVRVRWCWRLC